MSLLIQASPFSTVEGKREKMKGNMIETFKRIENEQFNNNNNNVNIRDTSAVQNLRSSKIEQVMENLHKTQPDNEGERLVDFVMPRFNTSPTDTVASIGKQNVNANVRTPVSYTRNKNSGSSFSQSYGSTPYYQGIAPKSKETTANELGSSHHLMEKLNYMINLLEQSQDERTNNVTEEIVLYIFLGIFIIFIIDSFVRVGRYSR